MYSGAMLDPLGTRVCHRHRETQSRRVPPSTPTHHLQQSQVPGPDVVEVDLDVLPAAAVVGQVQAVRLVVDDVDGEDLVRGGVDAVIVLPREQVDAHDAEDEPEDEADQQHVHDGGDGAQQSVHHHLERPEHTEELRGLI